MPKRENTPYDTLKIIEKQLADRLKKPDDGGGRWRYPDGQNDETLASEYVHLGCTPSAVTKMRKEKHPGGLIIQQLHKREPKPKSQTFAYPGAGGLMVDPDLREFIRQEVARQLEEITRPKLDPAGPTA